jgi:hypothetical protein
MHWFLCFFNLSSESSNDALMAKADAKKRDFCVIYDLFALAKITLILRIPGAR